jgi:hypothetical protein
MVMGSLAQTNLKSKTTFPKDPGLNIRVGYPR